MQDTLQSLVERALSGQPGFLEFYLRDQSRLPGARANVELAQDLSLIPASLVLSYPHEMQALLNHLVRDEKNVVSNTPEEFVLMCGVLGTGVCAAIVPQWRNDAFTHLSQYACNLSWRVREMTALALQKLLITAQDEILPMLMSLLDQGECLQLRVCLATISDSSLLHSDELINAALIM